MTTNNVITIILVVLFCVAWSIIVHFFIKPRFEKRKKINASFVVEVSIVLVWVVGIFLICKSVPSLSSVSQTIAASSGLAAIVLGLAAQESFSNILAGFMISAFKPFEIGDRISISGEDINGFVESINLRHTIIRTYTNVSIIIPNSVIGAAKIENSTLTDGISYPIELTVAYEDDDKRMRAMQIMEEVVMAHPLFYDNRSKSDVESGVPATRALCTGFDESGIRLKILMWTKTFVDNPIACSDCRMEILRRFEKEGIEIPYNKIIIEKIKIPSQCNTQIL